MTQVHHEKNPGEKPVRFPVHRTLCGLQITDLRPSIVRFRRYTANHNLMDSKEPVVIPEEAQTLKTISNT